MFRQELIDIRKRVNMTQTQLAKEAGVTQQTISLFERGGDVSTKTLEKIAYALGCEMIVRKVRREENLG